MGRGKGGKNSKKQKGQVPGQFAGKTVRLPLGTQIGTPGDAICYAFNSGFCAGAVPGQRCQKGWHVCAEPGCQQALAMINHGQSR